MESLHINIEIAKALTVDYYPERVFVLKQELSLYEVYQKEITAIDSEIEGYLANFEAKRDSKPPTIKKARKKVNCKLS